MRRRESGERRPDRPHGDEWKTEERIQCAGDEQHAPAAETVEDEADERSGRDARCHPEAEQAPDREFVAAERTHEQRKEKEHRDAHPAREVDGTGEPERGGVEARPAHQSNVCVYMTATPVTRSWPFARSAPAVMLSSRSMTSTPPRDTAFRPPEIQSP